ncbi:MAG TPA: MOSC domain-containing protein [Verrucomicrobiae bacterium]|nr:MOSC domain-containing protein [Verrucomicrobiae bacterium]
MARVVNVDCGGRAQRRHRFGFTWRFARGLHKNCLLVTVLEVVNAVMPNPLHLSIAELEAGLKALSQPSKDSGRVVMIVCRRAPGAHESVQQVHLSIDDGVTGDEWKRRAGKLDAQITVIRRDVSALISNGQPLTTSGDNLIVDFDISAENLPVGTRLRVGKAVVEMTPLPHNGCKKFAARFGKDAVIFCQAPPTRHLNLRGIHWKVIEPGEVRVGDTIQVLSRPKP